MPRSPSLDAYLRSTETVTDEVDVRLRIAEGALPEGLRGVLYRNGPGKMEVFGTKYEPAPHMNLARPVPGVPP